MPNPAASSFDRNCGCVMAPSVSISFKTAPATNAPRIASRPNFSASTTKIASRTNGAPDSNLRRRVLELKERARNPHRTPRAGQRHRAREHEQRKATQQDELGTEPARLLGEEEREQHERHDVRDRGTGQHDLAELGLCDSGILQDGDDHSERGSRRA